MRDELPKAHLDLNLHGTLLRILVHTIHVLQRCNKESMTSCHQIG